MVAKHHNETSFLEMMEKPSCKGFSFALRRIMGYRVQNIRTITEMRRSSKMITVDHIAKEYNQKTVLQDINMTIEPGQSIAFTGHNGCGKSTLLKIIAGLVRPTTGKVHYERPFLFHYVPEHFPKMHLTAEQYLLSMGKMDGLEEKEAKKQILALAEDFFFQDMLKTPLKHLSKGSLQKAGVIQALLKEPEVLLLDEPLSGQDVASQQVFIDKMNALRKKGVVLLMSCHEPYLIDAITDCEYRLEGGILSAVEERNLQEEQWYVLHFKSGRQCKIPERWKGHLQFVENGCNLRVEEKDCNAAVIEMVQAGWDMRGMRNESDV